MNENTEKKMFRCYSQPLVTISGFLHGKRCLEIFHWFEQKVELNKLLESITGFQNVPSTLKCSNLAR